MEFFKNKNKIKIYFINDLNLRKQANDLGLKIWQTPSFLFMVLGVVAIIIMVVTYFIYKNYDNPEVLVVSECLIVITILVVELFINRFVDQMARLNKMKSEFIAIASHQLRTPLSAIKWESELLLTKLKKGLNKKQLKYIENIAVINNQMIELVKDLLDVARIDQNRLILRKQKFGLLQITKDVISEILPKAEDKNIEISLNEKKDFPLVLGDKEKVKSVLENLLDNSIKYTNYGGKIKIRIFKEKGRLVFEIKDNGVGIPEEQTERVFEKFFRSDNIVKYQTDGTGLGLYIAKNIIEQLGGEIWFKSIENVGSVFSFSLPISK